MNSSPRALGAKGVASDESGWHQQFVDWKGLLEECQRKPSRGRVHALRVATLRLEAEVEHAVGRQGDGQAASPVARRWTRQAEKLRRALSRVRETDVHLSKLDRLRPWLAPSSLGYVPRSSRLTMQQIDALERSLNKERKEEAKRLTAEIEARSARLERASQAAEAELSTSLAPDRGTGAEALHTMLGDVAARFPKLDADCLHDFRKSIKKVRYQAERFAQTDPEAKEIAVALKQMQDASGDWHDWHALAKIAERRFGSRSRRGRLGELLATLAGESLEKALEFCTGQMARLRGSTGEEQLAARALAPKKGVQRESLSAKNQRSDLPEAASG
jgi:CHAD domain-containing protein